jgi:hypothetical protein
MVTQHTLRPIRLVRSVSPGLHTLKGGLGRSKFVLHGITSFLFNHPRPQAFPDPGREVLLRGEFG